MDGIIHHQQHRTQNLVDTGDRSLCPKLNHSTHNRLSNQASNKPINGRRRMSQSSRNYATLTRTQSEYTYGWSAVQCNVQLSHHWTELDGWGWMRTLVSEIARGTDTYLFIFRFSPALIYTTLSQSYLLALITQNVVLLILL